jgi:hypothetical protein
MALKSDWNKSANCPDSGPVSPTSKFIYHGTHSLFHMHTQIRGVMHLIHSGLPPFESLNTEIYTFSSQYLKWSLSAALSLIKNIRRWKLTLCTMRVSSFLTSALDRGDCSAWWLGYLPSEKRDSGPPWIENWVGPGSGLDVVERRYNSCHCRHTNLRSFSLSAYSL